MWPSFKNRGFVDTIRSRSQDEVILDLWSGLYPMACVLIRGEDAETHRGRGCKDGGKDL